MMRNGIESEAPDQQTKCDRNAALTTANAHGARDEHGAPPVGPLPGRAWTVARMVEARTRVSRGLLLYRPTDIAAVILAEAEAEEQSIEQRAAGARAAGLEGSPDHGESLSAARAAVAERRVLAARVVALRGGDVAAARVLAQRLADAAYRIRGNCTADAVARAEVVLRGAHLVERYLVPRCIVWEAPVLTVDADERDILTRALAGMPDVRTPAADRLGDTAEAEPRLSCRELRELLDLTDAVPPHLQGWRRAPGPGRGPGVVLVRPEEVAHMLEAEARLYEHAAELLLGTHAEQGQGNRLRQIAKALCAAVWRVRRLAPGDVEGATALVEAIRHECRTTARRSARHLWESSVTHLELIAEYVQDYLLPLRVDAEYGAISGPKSEREVHRRWMAGAVDLREVIWQEARREA